MQRFDEQVPVRDHTGGNKEEAINESVAPASYAASEPRASADSVATAPKTWRRGICKTMVAQYYQNSTCGVGTGAKPCIKKTTKNGNVTCAIKTAAKCVSQSGFAQVSCPSYATCIDAADTNLDGIIDSGDSGACACTTGFQDNGDGTITDCTTRLMWEKKDRSGGVHDVNTAYSWAGLCGCATCTALPCPPNTCTGTEPLCQPNVAAASACALTTGGAPGCAQCVTGACNVNPLGAGAATTVWDWASQLNAAQFAGYGDWVLPSVGKDGGQPQLETLLLPVCQVFPNPCTPPAFNTACTPGCSTSTCSCTGADFYLSATTELASPEGTWSAYFGGSLAPPPSTPAIRGKSQTLRERCGWVMRRGPLRQRRSRPALPPVRRRQRRHPLRSAATGCARLGRNARLATPPAAAATAAARRATRPYAVAVRRTASSIQVRSSA